MAKRGKARKGLGIKRSRIIEKYKSAYKNRRVVTIVSTIVALALLIYGALVFVEFLQFKNAESKIKSFQKEISEIAGPPVEGKASGFCHYTSAKFSRGDLSCGYFSYSIFDSADQTNDTLKNYLSDRFDTHLDSFEGKGDYYVLLRDDSFLDLKCRASISVNKEEPNLITYTYNCSKTPALTSHYPVED